MNRPNKLERLSLIGFTSLTFVTKVGAYPSEAPFRFSTLGDSPSLTHKYYTRLEKSQIPYPISPLFYISGKNQAPILYTIYRTAIS